MKMKSLNKPKLKDCDCQLIIVSGWCVLFLHPLLLEWNLLLFMWREKKGWLTFKSLCTAQLSPLKSNYQQ